MISENRTRVVRRPVDARKILGSATVVDGPLNIRKTPSIDGELIAQAQKDQKFNVTEGSTSDFTAIIYKDEVRYAMTKYLEVSLNA